MTTQELFDKVAVHLLTQDQRSMGHFIGHSDDRPQCAYRGDKGRMCAIGCLITDEHYDIALESKLLYGPSPGSNAKGSDPYLAVVNSIGRELTNVEVDMLMRLQEVHDKRTVCSWPFELRFWATNFGLECPPELR